MFISIDGVDGCGKTTQVALLAGWLEACGRQVVVYRDPGATPLGEVLRRVLLEQEDLQIDVRSEMLLYMAARAQMVQQLICPALVAGKTIVCDRYLLANVVYQGHAGGLGAATVWQVGRVATSRLMPDLTVVLDLPAEQAAQRRGREPDRIERRSADFQRRVRKGFLKEARRGRPPRPESWRSGSELASLTCPRAAEIRTSRPAFVLVDSTGPIDEVQAEIRRHVERLLG